MFEQIHSHDLHQRHINTHGKAWGLGNQAGRWKKKKRQQSPTLYVFSFFPSKAVFLAQCLDCNHSTETRCRSTKCDWQCCSDAAIRRHWRHLLYSPGDTQRVQFDGCHVWWGYRGLDTQRSTDIFLRLICTHSLSQCLVSVLWSALLTGHQSPHLAFELATTTNWKI